MSPHTSRALLYKFVIVFVISLPSRLHGNNLLVAAAAAAWQPAADCSAAKSPRSSDGLESGNAGTQLPLKSAAEEEIYNNSRKLGRKLAILFVSKIFSNSFIPVFNFKNTYNKQKINKTFGH